MGCKECGKPKCNGECGCKSPKVLQINNPAEYITFHKVSIPAAMGDSTTNPPKIGAYRNALVYYEADHTSWMYSTDGIPTKLTNGLTDYNEAVNLPQINGHTLIGNQSSPDLGLQGELTAGNGIKLDGAEIKAKIGDGLEFGNNGEINIANIEQYAHFFDTVADMKASKNLINGSYTRTLGFYAKNDGGGATYKIRGITNDDVVDEAKIIEMGDGSNNLIAELIVEEPVNIKTLGAYGDGTHDDYAKIQNGIDKFHQHTLYFPSGTYLITQPLSIGTTNAEQVDFKLESDATIKTNTAIDSLLEIGKYEGAWQRNVKGAIVTIDGGIFDASNTTQAIYTTSNRKNTLLRNIEIINVSNYGIRVDLGTNTSNSADLNIDNVNINGTGSGGNSTGIQLNAYDNKLRNMRINSCTIAVDDHSGNFYQNVHALAAWSNGTLNQANYEKTIGFKFRGGGVSKLNQCYADTFGTAFEFNTAMKVYLNDCQSYHYLSDLTYETVLFKYKEQNANLKLYVTNFDYTPPSKTGDGKNYGLDIRSANTNFKQYFGVFDVFHFDNIQVNELGRIEHDDYINCRNLYPKDSVVLRDAWSLTMKPNKYYPIAILRGACNYDMKIDMATDQTIKATFIHGGTPNLKITNLRNSSHQKQYSLALCNTDTSEGVRKTYLCVKTTASDCSFNPCISEFQGWNAQLFTRRWMGTPLESPTVLAEASFNPA